MIKKFLVIAILIIGVFALNNFVFKNPIQNRFHHFFSKPGSWLMRQAEWPVIIKNGWLNARNLVAENLRLKEENYLLKSSLFGKGVIEKENEILRRQLKVNSRSEHKLVLAGIFGIQRTPASSTLVIDKGVDEGIKEGAVVITAGNLFVGLVKEIFENSSVVWLIDDPRLAVDVMIQGANTIGRTRGLTNGFFSVDFVSQVESVKTGDTVLTAGLGGVKEALLVGEIKKIGEESGGLFRDVQAKSFFEIMPGGRIFVILPDSHANPISNGQ